MAPAAYGHRANGDPPGITPDSTRALGSPGLAVTVGREPPLPPG
jgi:hypothetical protein